MKKFALLICLLLPFKVLSQGKNAEIVGKYTGQIPHRRDYFTHKPSIQPNSTEYLRLHINHKCSLKGRFGTYYGKWALNGDTLTCSFTKEKSSFSFGKRRSKHPVSYSYHVNSESCLIPLNSKIRFCKK